MSYSQNLFCCSEVGGSIISRLIVSYTRSLGRKGGSVEPFEPLCDQLVHVTAVPDRNDCSVLNMLCDTKNMLCLR